MKTTKTALPQIAETATREELLAFAAAHDLLVPSEGSCFRLTPLFLNGQIRAEAKKAREMAKHAAHVAKCKAALAAAR